MFFKLKNTFKLSLILAIFIISPSLSDEFQLGQKAFQNGNIEKAINHWRPIASKGNSLAQYKLGVLYEKGNGVDQNSAESFYWWKLAASNGHARSQYHLGILYYQGKGTEKNFDNAASWIKKSAENGDKFAHVTLGLFYLDGHGVNKNLINSYMWLEIASKKGVEIAKQSKVFVKSKMSKSQIKKAEKLALSCEKNNYKNCI